MLDKFRISGREGVTLIELLIVISIIGILSIVGIPEYGRFIAKNKVRSAASNMFQSMRLAKTMAIKENRAYMLTFDYASNVYRVGFDGDNNNILDETSPNDAYGDQPVKVINIETNFGDNIVIGSGNFTTTPPNGPNGIAIANAVSFQFNPDGSASPNSIIYFQHNGTDRGYTYGVELANSSGTIDLFLWKGHSDNTSETEWTEIK